jgi:anti-sigma factor RsiW
MQPRISNEELMQFLDQELDPDERARIERELATSTELQRELARYRSMRAELKSLGTDIRPPGVWAAIHRKLTRPVGWLLLVAGVVLSTGWGSWLYFTSEEDLVLKFATGAVVIGVALLLGATIQERWVEWQTDPYRDIQK